MSPIEQLKRLFSNSKFYCCRNCGYRLPKKDAVVSGWDSQQRLRHVHCPKCGKIIAHVT